MKTICLASGADRSEIYRLRHDVFARELGQHSTTDTGMLSDQIDEFNVYIVIKRGDEICGHISLTPPSTRGYSIEKYVPLESLPFEIDAGTYEARLLTVRDVHRGSGDAILLMYASYDWVRAQGGSQIIAMGRKEVLPLYERSGFSPCGVKIRSGRVDYEVMRGTIPSIAKAVDSLSGHLEKALQGVEYLI